MKRWNIQGLSFVLIVLLSCFGMAAERSTGELRFIAQLSGSEEVPPLNTDAEGEVSFRVVPDRNTVSYSISVLRIKEMTGASIHSGKRGEKGPAIYRLLVEPKRLEVSGTLLAEGELQPYLLIGSFKGQTLIPLLELMKAEGAYVNIYTKSHPEGEIRGQISAHPPLVKRAP